MLGHRRRTQRDLMDPAVVEVERILAEKVPTKQRSTSTREGAEHALWICACITVDDSPTWLIYDTPDDQLVWMRVPDSVEPLELVDARVSAGGHSDPSDVLRWLQQDAPDPWGSVGSGFSDQGVLDHLRAKICDQQA